MQQNFKSLFSDLPDHSRVWVYASNRPLNENECSMLIKELDAFVSTWSTHGSSLTARASVLENRFVVIAADEKRMAASGCSIDSSVRFIKDVGSKLGVDFFDRLHVYIEKEGVFDRVNYYELNNYKDHRQYLIQINNLGELRNQWPYCPN